jgi:hypothetical protein
MGCLAPRFFPNIANTCPRHNLRSVQKHSKMLSVSRAASLLSRRAPAFRSFAQVVDAASNESSTPTTPPVSAKRTNHVLGNGRIPVREDHGLYGFFRRKEPKEGETLVGDAKYEVVETPEKMQKVTGMWFSIDGVLCRLEWPKDDHGEHQSYG